MNNNNALWIVIVILVAAVVGLAAYMFTINRPMPVEPDGGIGDGAGPICTMEAKQCPDGSYVGRQGPNCEFAPCPSGIKVEVQ